MSLGDYEKKVIQAVAENDIREAKKWAVAALDADKTQKNRYFVSRYRSILTSSGANMIELPDNLKDILLCEDVSLSFHEGRYYKTERQEKIAQEIFKMSKVSQRLMEMQIPYKNATLLYGPPGTGKTLFGRYIAYKMQLPFCYLNFSRVVDSYMGATSRNISQVFSYASSNPCVFMLDEIDTISSSRTKDTTSTDKELGRVTITLMQEFDRLPNDVVVIAATNRIDMMDKAFLSRISAKYEMLPYTEPESRDMVHKFLADVGIVLPEAAIEAVCDGKKDQRMIMNQLIREIANTIAEEKDKEV